MLRKVSLDGPGRARARRHGIVTRDVSTLTPGQIAYGALCNERREDDRRLHVHDAIRGFACASAARTTATTSSSRPPRRARGIDVREHTDATPHLCLQGPRSRDILQGLTSSDLSNAAFPYYTFREDVEIAGIPVFMTRLGYTAELGYELWVDARPRPRALGRADRGRSAGRDERSSAWSALDLFRIEGGFIIGGVEYDETVSPYECGLGWSVDLDKADFQGRDGCVRDRDATTLRLTSVVLEGGGDDGERRAALDRRPRRRPRHPGGRVSASRRQDAGSGEDRQGPAGARDGGRGHRRGRGGPGRDRPPPRVRPGAQTREGIVGAGYIRPYGRAGRSGDRPLHDVGRVAVAGRVAVGGPDEIRPLHLRGARLAAHPPAIRIGALRLFRRLFVLERLEHVEPGGAARREDRRASMPAMIATITNTIRLTTGTEKTSPSSDSACVTSTASRMPSTIPSAVPISAVITLSWRIIWRT